MQDDELFVSRIFAFWAVLTFFSYSIVGSVAFAGNAFLYYLALCITNTSVKSFLR